MIKIHFPILDELEPVVGLACALHVGGADSARWLPGPEERKYDQLNREADESFESVSLNEADMVVLPYRASHHSSEVQRIAAEARRRNIGCVFFSWGDGDDHLPVSYGTVYRHSITAETRYPNEMAMPAEVSDPWKELGQRIMPRDKTDRPSVGFCGFVSNPLMRRVYRAMGRTQKAESLELRAKVLRTLRRSSDIDTNFIVRQSYWAGTLGRFHINRSDQRKPRMAFWNNVIDTDYTVCMRGAGNFSYRFYEVLAAGRIPLFINTDCVLPFEDEIDWREHCVWVEQSEIEFAGEILRNFHSRLSEKQFRQIQISNRRLWERKLSPLAFYKNALGREVPQPMPLPMRRLPARAPLRIPVPDMAIRQAARVG